MVSQFHSLQLTNINQGRFGEPLTEITTASQWFCSHFPKLAKIYGAPFLENTRSSVDGFTTTSPLAPNPSFMAACLGGDSGREVVYWGADCMFYYLEPVANTYYPLPDSKLGDLMDGWFCRCAQEMQRVVNVYPLFTTFRSDQVIQDIVDRAKSILLAAEDFFSTTSPYQRVNGVELHERLARVFVEKMLVPKPDEIMLVGAVYEQYAKLVRAKDLVPIKRSQFKHLLNPLIREKFNSGLRADLIVGGRYQQGWKGIGFNITAPG